MKNMGVEEKVLQELREEGYRVTRVRREMIGMLAAAKAPLAAADILQKLGTGVNKTTVYRELDFLLAQGIAQEVEFGDKKKRYEISAKHHHHVVCMECKNVEDVDLQSDLAAAERKIAKQKGYTIINHSLEFFGLCSSCK